MGGINILLLIITKSNLRLRQETKLWRPRQGGGETQDTDGDEDEDDDGEGPKANDDATTAPETTQERTRRPPHKTPQQTISFQS